MSLFVKTTTAPLPRTPDTMKIAILYAAILVIMAVAQLFSFDTFLPYMQSVGLSLTESTIYVLVPLLVSAEVFSAPFLLRMSISPAFRAFSMLCSWLVAAIWFYITVWIVTTYAQVSTIGFLGTAIDLPPGWWAIFFSLALVVLTIWSSWGLWPGKRR